MVERRFKPDDNELRYPQDNVELHVRNVIGIERLFADSNEAETVRLFEAPRATLTPEITDLTVAIHPHETDSAFSMGAYIPRSIRMNVTVADPSRHNLKNLRGYMESELKMLTDQDVSVSSYGQYAGITFDNIGVGGQLNADLLSGGNTLSLRSYATTDTTEAGIIRNHQTLRHFYTAAMILTNGLLEPSAGELVYTDKPTISLGLPEYTHASKDAEPNLEDTMDSIGGMTAAKERLREIKESMEDPEMALEYGIEPGPAIVLLHGKPGVGKTTLIKTFAKELGAQLREVTSMEIIDKWIGSTARNIKPLFQEAITASKEYPVVLFFKEIDSMILRNDGHRSDEHVQLLAAFKTLIDDINDLGEEYKLTLIADTNSDLDKLEPALIRPGRFEPISCNLPNLAEREDIWRRIILGEEMKRQSRLNARASSDIDALAAAQDFDIAALAEAGNDSSSVFSTDVDPEILAGLTENFSGADFRGILTTIRREKLRRAKGARAIGEQTDVNTTRARQITQADLEQAIKNFGIH